MCKDQCKYLVEILDINGNKNYQIYKSQTEISNVFGISTRTICNALKNNNTTKSLLRTKIYKYKKHEHIDLEDLQ